MAFDPYFKRYEWVVFQFYTFIDNQKMKRLPHQRVMDEDLYFIPRKSRSSSLTTDLFSNGLKKGSDLKRKILPKDELLLVSTVSTCCIQCHTNNSNTLILYKRNKANRV